MSVDSLKITQEIFIPVPIDRVWEFLMNEEEMRNWFDAEAFVIDIVEGGKIEIPFSYGGEQCLIVGEIGLILPQEKFAFTWIERDRYGESWFNNTTVTVKLKENDVGTMFTLIHDGFNYLPKEIQASAYEKYQAFWGEFGMLERLLSKVLEKGKEH